MNTNSQPPGPSDRRQYRRLLVSTYSSKHMIAYMHLILPERIKNSSCAPVLSAPIPPRQVAKCASPQIRMNSIKLEQPGLLIRGFRRLPRELVQRLKPTKSILASVSLSRNKTRQLTGRLPMTSIQSTSCLQQRARLASRLKALTLLSE